MNEKRFTMDNPNDWGFPITDNQTGKVYSCASNEQMKALVKVINELNDEDKQMKQDIGILLEVVKRATDFDITKMYNSELEACNRLKGWIQ